MFHTFLSIFPFTVCLFWTAVFLLEWREANPAKHVLTLFMGVSTTLYLCHALFFNGLSTPATESIYDFCNIAVFPLYLIYIQRLTDNRPLSWRHGLLLAPAVLMGLWAAFAQSFPPGVQNARLLMAKSIFILQLLIICWIGLRRLRDFDQKIANFFSNTEQRSVKHTRHMMAALFICSCCSAVASIIGREHFLSNTSQLIIPSLGFGLLLFFIGFVGQKQLFCADDMDLSENAEPLESLASLEQLEKVDATPSPLLQNLEALMTAEHLYLQTDLRLSDVAALLNVSRTTLSAAINQSAGVSFSDYVNGYRIRHAQDIMRNNPQSSTLSIIQIAEQSGFTSESSFYRTFRKHAGMTPKQWQTEK